MSRIPKAGAILILLLSVAFLVHELRHLRRYGHLVPLSMHLDLSMTTSDDVLGVDGIAKIYEAKLTNYGILPSSLVVCDYRLNGMPGIDVNYVVERWDRQSRKWTPVPEWDFYGYRLFCRPVFEVTDQHLVRRRLWPGQSIEVGQGIPGQLGGFQIGDEGRFTVFLQAENKGANALSTVTFRVDQQPKNARRPPPRPQ